MPGRMSTEYKKLAPMLWGSHIKIWKFANHMKKEKKNIKMLDLLMKNWKLRVWCSLFQLICKISNLNMWTTKHLTQASYIELTLLTGIFHDVISFLQKKERRQGYLSTATHQMMEKGTRRWMSVRPASLLYVAH